MLTTTTTNTSVSAFPADHIRHEEEDVIAKEFAKQRQFLRNFGPSNANQNKMKKSSNLIETAQMIWDSSFPNLNQNTKNQSSNNKNNNNNNSNKSSRLLSGFGKSQAAKKGEQEILLNQQDEYFANKNENNNTKKNANPHLVEEFGISPLPSRNRERSAEDTDENNSSSVRFFREQSSSPHKNVVANLLSLEDDFEFEFDLPESNNKNNGGGDHFDPDSILAQLERETQKQNKTNEHDDDENQNLPSFQERKLWQDAVSALVKEATKNNNNPKQIQSTTTKKPSIVVASSSLLNRNRRNARFFPHLQEEEEKEEQEKQLHYINTTSNKKSKLTTTSTTTTINVGRMLFLERKPEVKVIQPKRNCFLMMDKKSKSKNSFVINNNYFSRLHEIARQDQEAAKRAIQDEQDRFDRVSRPSLENDAAHCDQEGFDEEELLRRFSLLLEQERHEVEQKMKILVDSEEPKARGSIRQHQEHEAWLDLKEDEERERNDILELLRERFLEEERERRIKMEAKRKAEEEEEEQQQERERELSQKQKFNHDNNKNNNRDYIPSERQEDDLESRSPEFKLLSESENQAASPNRNINKNIIDDELDDDDEEEEEEYEEVEEEVEEEEEEEFVLAPSKQPQQQQQSKPQPKAQIVQVSKNNKFQLKTTKKDETTSESDDDDVVAVAASARDAKKKPPTVSSSVPPQLPSSVKPAAVVSNNVKNNINHQNQNQEQQGVILSGTIVNQGNRNAAVALPAPQNQNNQQQQHQQQASFITRNELLKRLTNEYGLLEPDVIVSVVDALFPQNPNNSTQRQLIESIQQIEGALSQMQDDAANSFAR
jgi:hypothetical protein